MLLKPYIPPKEVKVNSLLSESGNSHKDLDKSREYQECIKFLESEGRLLMLTTLYHERALKKNKLIHDVYRVFACVYPWPLCVCNFSRMIRGMDMGMKIERIDYLREIL